MKPKLIQGNLKDGIAMSPIACRGQDIDMERLSRLIDIISVLINKKFTGYIRINFSRGTIGSVEKFEEILKK
jgi:hypothetical protein